MLFDYIIYKNDKFCQVKIMLSYQLDLFKTPEESEMEALRKAFLEVKESADRVRKKLFAENGKLVKQVIDLTQRMEIIERNICQTNYLP